MDTAAPSPTTIPLARITLDPDLQPRVDGVDSDHVRELEAIAEDWPPLKVVARGDGFVLVDGFHRYAAAQNLALASVPVLVLAVREDEDLHALAFALNAMHGRPLTLSDRRAFAVRLLRSNPTSSDREIGRRCGLTQPTVAKVRQELERSATIEPAEKRVGRDGRAYSATPKKPAPAHTIGAAITDMLGGLFSPVERKAQRRLARYLEQLAALLDERETLPSFDTIDDAANACRVVLGEEGAKSLGDRLGCSSIDVLEIARALGFREDTP